MKKTLRRIALTALLLTVFGATGAQADGVPAPPICPPSGCSMSG